MENKKYFFAGLAAGLLSMTVIAAGFMGVRSRVRWEGKVSPDAKVAQIYNMLDAHSINPFDRAELMEDMYRGLLDGVGDPYTYYFDKESLAAFTIQTEGTYVGIGVVVSPDPEDRVITLVTVYPGTPAEQAGLKPGDKILQVDGADMAGKPMEEVTGAIKGPAGTRVTLRVYRGEEELDITVTRESINIPTVSHKMLDGVIGYIRIEGFERVTLGQFTEAYEDLRAHKMRGLIIDVRNNPGGLLETVSQIADILLPKGVITYTEDKNGEQRFYNSDESQANLPLALLVNGNSASASEVLGGAVRDLGGGVLVGERTFGKGIVQNLYPLSDGSAVKITVAKYYTPGGVCIQGEGLVPDYIVAMPPELALRAGTLEAEDDAQLKKAIEVIWEKMM